MHRFKPVVDKKPDEKKPKQNRTDFKDGYIKHFKFRGEVKIKKEK